MFQATALILGAAGASGAGTLIIQLLGATGIGAILSAIINAVLNRRKFSADVSKVITDAAAGVLQRLEAENRRILSSHRELRGEFETFRREAQQREDHWQALLRQHAEWDQHVVTRLRELGATEIPDPPPLDVRPRIA